MFPPVPTRYRDGPAFPTPARVHVPTNTKSKFEDRTTFKTIARTQDPTPSHAGGMVEVRERGPSLVSETSFDATSFFPKPTRTTQSTSGTSNNPTTTTDGNVPSSTSNSGATPSESPTNGQGSKKPSTAVIALLAVIGAIVILAVGIYLGRRHYKRKAQKRSGNIQPMAPEENVDPHEQPHSPRRRQHYISKRLSEIFFAPSSRATLESVPPRRKKDLQFPATVTQGTNAPFSPAGERIPMRDLRPPGGRQPTQPLEPGPSNPHPHMATSSSRRGHAPALRQTTTTIGSLLNYYDSGNGAKTHSYEPVSSGSHTPGRHPHETTYQESISEDLEREPELEHDRRRLYNRADDFEPATVYGQGYINRTPDRQPRPDIRHRGIDGNSTSSRNPTSPSQTVFSDPHYPVDVSDMTSETTHSPFLEALEERYGPADNTETESLDGTIQPIAQNPGGPAMQSRLDALAKLEYSSPRRNNNAVNRNERGEGVIGRQKDPRLDTSTSNVSDLRPSPLRIQKADSPPYPQNSSAGLSRMPEQRTGYEEYMGNPYVGVRDDRDDMLTEEHPPLHVQGSYETWAREQRRERSERAAGYRHGGVNTGAINHTRGESSGSQPRRPLYPVAEHREDDFDRRISPQRQAQAHAGEYDAYAVSHEHQDNREVPAVHKQGRRQNQDTDRRASREWYHRIRDRLRTQTPDSSRLSQAFRGIRASEDAVDKGKGVADKDQDNAYTYASTCVSDDVFLPRVQALRADRASPNSQAPVASHSTAPTTARFDSHRPRPPPVAAGDIGIEGSQDTVPGSSHDAKSRSKLRDKTSARWKRLSGGFRKRGI